MDRVRNEEVCRRAVIERKFSSRMHRLVLRWFEHVERMDEYRMASREFDGGIEWRTSEVKLDERCEGGLWQ